MEAVGPIYTSTVLTPQDDGTYFAQVAMPTEGYTAFFVEAEWDSGIASAPFKFTTGVSVIPDTVSFKWEDAAAKYAETKK
jgi:PhoPQ-activated pathogenicity-related protein